MIENRLKKQLAQIKARALRLRNQPREVEEPAGERGAPEPPAPSPAAAESQRIVEDVVETGAVVRGADFDKLRTVRRRWPWQRKRGDGDGDHDPLARYRTGAPRDLETVAPGEARAIDGDPYYLITARGRDVDPEAADEAARFARLERWPDSVTATVVGGRKRSQRMQPELFDPERALFLDIETTGLSANTYLFLCGLMFMRDGEFVCELVFARDYNEEAGLLHHVRDAIDNSDVVVTYNGESFDMPFIRTRMAIQRIPDIQPVMSVDLLHAARRVFRGILPNRKLITVEKYLRGVGREGDIPSRYIPAAYHDFVRTRDAQLMENVLYHNRMDLYAMSVIATRLDEVALL